MKKTSSRPAIDESQYWATLPAKDLIQRLVARRQDFQRNLVSSGLFRRIERNWRYYHGLFHEGGYGNGLAIETGDEEGGSELASVNHFRQNAEQAITFIAGEKPAWDSRAKNATWKARRECTLMNDLLEIYCEDGSMDEALLRFARHAYVLSMGFMYFFWDWTKGDQVRPDENNVPMSSGDVAWANPTILDVVWDYTHPDYRCCPWVEVTLPESRWDLLARVPEGKQGDYVRDAIRGAPAYGDSNYVSEIRSVGLQSDRTDLIAVRHFWHLPTPAMRAQGMEGRHLAYVADECPMEDGPNDYGCLPLARLTFSEFLLTCLGYTNAFDMQQPQEWFGLALSTSISILNILGQPKLIVYGEEIPPVEELEPGSGIAVIRYNTPQQKPEVLNFYNQAIQGIHENLSLAVQQQEYMAGSNPVQRGQLEGELKGASGSALALLDSKALQANSLSVKVYKQALGEVGTIVLKILKVKAREPRISAMVGKRNERRLQEWSAESIKDVELVVVEAGSPLSRSIAGRVQLAETFADKEWITTPQEFLTVVETGQWKPLVDAVESQLEAIAEENERLIQNEEVNDQLLQLLEFSQESEDVETVKGLLQVFGVVALRSDNHILHYRRNLSILSTTELRMTRGIAVPTLAHAWIHLKMIMDPDIQREQLLLGYITGEQLQSFLASLQIPTGAPPVGGLPPPGAGAGGPGGPPIGPALAGETPTPRQTTPPPLMESGRPPQPPRVNSQAVKHQILEASPA